MIISFAWVTALLFGLGLFVVNYDEIRRLSKKPDVVKNYRQKSVYIVENGYRREIPDWNTFVTLGYDISDIKTLTDDKLNAIPLGPPVGQIWEEKTPPNPFKNCPCVSNLQYEASLDPPSNQPHLICIIENLESRVLKGIYDSNKFSIHHKYVSDSILKYYSNYSTIIEEDEYKDCDVIIRFTSDQNYQKFSCPEMCLPKPITVLPLKTLKQHSNAESATDLLTCTMTYQELFNGNTTFNHHHSHPHEMNEEDHSHTSVGLLLKAIAKRRVEECNEKHLWTSGHHSAIESTFKPVSRRKVHGLIIWVGSRDRYDLSESQIRVLENRTYEQNDVIAGWIASEDQYPCKVGSTLCEDASNNNAYFPYMPTTRLNVASAGWACAQRRVLRAIAHTLLLYDPNFMLVVDDDTYVSIGKFEPNSVMDRYIREKLAYENVVLGQLTKGKKITKHGFYYGGAGYFFGKTVIDNLQSNMIYGPVEKASGSKDPTQMSELSLFNEVYPKSEKSCPGCVKLANDSSPYRELGAYGESTVRLIDLCVNTMAQEHTCFHSDHSMSRCLLHGANANPVSMECQGSGVGFEGLGFAMCMGINYCNPKVQLTCHRWRPVEDNVYRPYNMEA